nr:hypothetical protein [Tanacetum cinerariifolium]
MVLPLTRTSPPKSNPPSLEESMATIVDSISKLIIIIDANIEKQRQTFDLMSTIIQTHQQNTIMSSTTNFAKPETTMAQALTAPSSSITNIEKVTAKNTTTVNVTTSTTITKIDNDTQPSPTRTPTSTLPIIPPNLAYKSPKLQQEISIKPFCKSLAAEFIKQYGGDADHDPTSKGGNRELRSEHTSYVFMVELI